MLVLAVLCPPSVRAQDPCVVAKDRIYRIADTPARQVPDSLQTLLDLVAFIRSCEPDIPQELHLWLLNNEVLALVSLGRFDETSARVEHFFATSFDQASDDYRARFYLWRMHLHALDGAHLASIIDYAEVQQYTHALDETTRSGLYLDGAYAYFGVHEHEAGLRLVEQAQRLLATPQTYEARLIATRALLLSGEARLRLRDSLDQVEAQFQEAARRYRVLGDTARAAVAMTLLGMTYATQGDTARAWAQMDSAAALAQRSGDARSRSYTRYRQGQLLRKARAYDQAEQVLSQALASTDSVGEFALNAAYELAMLYEEQRDLSRAARFYQRVVEAAPPDSLAASLMSVRQVYEAQIRLLLIQSERRQTRLRLALAGALVLLGLVSGGLLYLWYRRTLSPPTPVGEYLTGGGYIPQTIPTGLSLEQLRVRFQAAVKPALLGTRLTYLYAVLFEPDLVLDYIDDAYLRPQVEAGRIENNTALFRCTAAVEAILEDRTFKDDPANTLATYLRTWLRKRGWDWPKNPPEWKQHFIEHHAEILS